MPAGAKVSGVSSTWAGLDVQVSRALGLTQKTAGTHGWSIVQKRIGFIQEQFLGQLQEVEHIK